jgi:hypothetical protein
VPLSAREAPDVACCGHNVAAVEARFIGCPCAMRERNCVFGSKSEKHLQLARTAFESGDVRIAFTQSKEADEYPDDHSLTQAILSGSFGQVKFNNFDQRGPTLFFGQPPLTFIRRVEKATVRTRQMVGWDASRAQDDLGRCPFGDSFVILEHQWPRWGGHHDGDNSSYQRSTVNLWT